MTRQEFLETLRRKLNGRLSAAEVEDNIRYYDGYISREMAKGRSETEVLSDLGEPDLIARSILDARGAGGNERVYTATESRAEDFAGEEFGRTAWKVNQISGWKFAAVLILIAVVVLAIVVPVFVWVVKLAVPVIIVLAALVFIRDHFGSGRRR